ncbi:MAG: hypothetical protein ACAI44_10905 [Candidatus Sericytochromatia bacterium]
MRQKNLQWAGIPALLAKTSKNQKYANKWPNAFFLILLISGNFSKFKAWQLAGTEKNCLSPASPAAVLPNHQADRGYQVFKLTDELEGFNGRHFSQ